MRNSSARSQLLGKILHVFETETITPVIATVHISERIVRSLQRFLRLTQLGVLSDLGLFYRTAITAAALLRQMCGSCNTSACHFHSVTTPQLTSNDLYKWNVLWLMRLF